MKAPFKMDILKYTLMGIVVLMSLVLGIFFFQKTNTSENFDPAKLHGTYIPGGRPMPAFKLTSTEGKTLLPRDFRGHWSLLYFGFTQCHSICPAAMSELHKMNVILHHSSNMKSYPQVYMISLDPARDTIATLEQYVTGFDKDFKGALGSPEMIRQLSQHLGIVYDSQPRKDGQIDHSGSITVINPAGEVAAFFTPPLNAQLMADDLEVLSHHFEATKDHL